MRSCYPDSLIFLILLGISLFGLGVVLVGLSCVSVVVVILVTYVERAAGDSRCVDLHDLVCTPDGDGSVAKAVEAQESTLLTPMTGPVEVIAEALF